jgi:sulfoxide reductase heme-binding subunit YedZ
MAAQLFHVVAKAAQAPWHDRRGRFSLLKATTLALCFVPAIWLAWMLASHSLGPLPFGFVLYQTGLWSLWLLLACLAVTPVRAIFGWTGAVALRRMLGVAGLAYTLAHLIIYFTDRWPIAKFTAELGRRPTIGIALVATLGLLLLGLTSFDDAIRAMGVKAWNQLHNLVYPAVGLAILHFAMSPFSVSGVPYVIVGAFIWLMGWRVLRRLRLARSAPALTALAAATSVATFAFTLFWLVGYQHRPLVGEFRLAFDLGGGLSPAWQILLLGLAVPLLDASLTGRRAEQKAAATVSVAAA